MNEEPTIIVSGLRVTDNAIVLDYLQTTQQSKVAGIAEQAWIDLDECEEELADLQEILVELVDKAKLLVRNPPKRRRLGRKMLEEVEEQLGPDDDDEDE